MLHVPHTEGCFSSVLGWIWDAHTHMQESNMNGFWTSAPIAASPALHYWAIPLTLVLLCDTNMTGFIKTKTLWFESIRSCYLFYRWPERIIFLQSTESVWFLVKDLLEQDILHYQYVSRVLCKPSGSMRCNRTAWSGRSTKESQCLK